MKKSIRFWIRTAALVILFGIIAGYTYYRTRDLINGPIITLSSPQNASTVHNSELTVSGTVKNAVDVSLDDRKIFLDEEGRFSEKLLLANGYTIISLKAQDRFNRSVEKKLEVVFNSI